MFKNSCLLAIPFVVATLPAHAETTLPNALSLEAEVTGSSQLVFRGAEWADDGIVLDSTINATWKEEQHNVGFYGNGRIGLLTEDSSVLDDGPAMLSAGAGGFLEVNDQLTLSLGINHLEFDLSRGGTARTLEIESKIQWSQHLSGQTKVNLYARLIQEVSNKKDPFNPGNKADNEGVYGELGAIFDFGTHGNITFRAPIVLGLGLKDYYFDISGDDELFGYLMTGLEVSTPLRFGNDDAAWEATAGVYHYLTDSAVLNDTLEDSYFHARVGVRAKF